MDYQNIVTAMCKIGCDDLYEKGYIGVCNGKFVKIKNCFNPSVNEKVNELTGRICLGSNRKYYDAHLESFKYSLQ